MTNEDLEEFKSVSVCLADVIRSFIVPNLVTENLVAMATLRPTIENAVLTGPEHNWFIPWRDQIAQHATEAVTIRPFSDDPDNDIVRSTGHECAVLLLGACCRMIFTEDSGYDDSLHTESTLDQWEPYVREFVDMRFATLSQRHAKIAKRVNYSEWQSLAATLDIERNKLLVKPPDNEPSSWPVIQCRELREIFSIGQDTLLSRLESQHYPNVKLTTKSYQINPTCLPDGWQKIAFPQVSKAAKPKI